MSTRPEFLPSASIDTLRQRAEILRTIRQFFEQRGFFEVHTPLLSSESIVDVHIDPVAVSRQQLQLPDSGALQQFMYLQTSPEFAMKRLLAAGADAIYQICPAIRAGESGAWHNPEFMMLEWYRVGDGFEDGLKLLADFVQVVKSDSQCERLSYQDAFLEYAGIDPLSARSDQLRSEAARLRVAYHGPDVDEKDAWLNILFDQVVAPQLGIGVPTLLTHFPRSQAALARICEQDARTCERFELFIDGIELANGYGELLDVDALVSRSLRNNQERVADGKSPLPEPKLLRQAMESGLPMCSGCALGVDRLVAVMLDQPSIEDVIAFPIDRA